MTGSGWPVRDGRFGIVRADGDLFSWHKAHAERLDVQIDDPDVWVSQTQGPRSLLRSSVLRAVVLDGPMPDPFCYFGCAKVSIAGQTCWISRSRLINELGREVYLLLNTDIAAIGDRMTEVAAAFGNLATGTPVFRARRIEARLLNVGSDFGAQNTPFDPGFGGFVEFDDHDFAGRRALAAADRSCRAWGMRMSGGVAQQGRVMTTDGKAVGRVCSSGYAPYQDGGVCIMGMDDPAQGPGTQVDVICADGSPRAVKFAPCRCMTPTGSFRAASWWMF